MSLHISQQLYDYAVRLRLDGSLPTNPYSLYSFYQSYDPRINEEPKPSYSYIGLIAMAILSSPERRLVLSDIYQWILDHYPYFRARGPGWRNSIRHNLSLNDCFVKAGRSANGKGHYWCIHPANLEDFLSGDFRRRRAQRRVRKSMGLSVPEDDDDDDDEISSINEAEHHFENSVSKIPMEHLHANIPKTLYSPSTNQRVDTSNPLQHYVENIQSDATSPCEESLSTTKVTHRNQNLIKKDNQRKRCFDVDSLLAPEEPCLVKRQKCHFYSSEDLRNPCINSATSTIAETYA